MRQANNVPIVMSLVRLFPVAGEIWKKGIFVNGSYITMEIKGKAMRNDGNGKSDCKAMVKE